MYSSTLSLTSALDGCGWSTPHPGRFSPGKTRYPLYGRMVGPQGRTGQVRRISSPPAFDPRTFQPVASRYTDYATRPTETQCNRRITCTSATFSATNPRRTRPESNPGLRDEGQRQSSWAKHTLTPPSMAEVKTSRSLAILRPLPIFTNGNLMLFASIKNGMVHSLRTWGIKGKNLCFFVYK